MIQYNVQNSNTQATLTMPSLQTMSCNNSAVISDDSSTDSDNERTTGNPKGGIACQFPRKLHEMLDYVVEEGLGHIVSWRPHGRAFRVHKQNEFTNIIMPLFFGQIKYASFQRQLNLYGYSRFNHGTDKGAYYHSCMIRGDPQAVRGMVRRKIKGTRARRWLSPHDEPDFYSLPFAYHSEVNTPKKKSHQKVATSNNQTVHSVSPTLSLDDHQTFHSVSPTLSLEGLEPIPVTSSGGSTLESVECSAIHFDLGVEPTPISLFDENLLNVNSLGELFDDLPTFDELPTLL